MIDCQSACPLRYRIQLNRLFHNFHRLWEGFRIFQVGYDTHSPITSSQYAPHPFQEQNKGLLLRTHLGEVTIMKKKEGLLFNEITLI